MYLVFLPLGIQETIFLVQRIVFIFAFSLNIIALICLLKQTPPNQATFRNYLILIQVLVIITDALFHILLEPIPLFPLFAGYCCGWICSSGIVPPVAVLNKIEWVRDRGCFYECRNRTEFLQALIYILVAVSVLFSSTALLILMFVHMYYVLNQQNGKRSASSEAAIWKSLRVLFVQLYIPLAMIVGPSTVILLGLTFPSFICFEFSFTMFYIISLHSIGHNIILLSITDAYRKFILNFLRCAAFSAHKIATIQSRSPP